MPKDPTSILLGGYLVILIVRLLFTWFPGVGWMEQTIGFLSPITDPYLNLFRFVPPVGGLDLSPMLAILALQFAMDTWARYAVPAFSLVQ